MDAVDQSELAQPFLFRVPKKLDRDAPHPPYYIDGKRVWGASTIAGVHKPIDPLMGWVAKLTKEGKDYRTERDSSADTGTIAHFMVDCYLNGYTWDLSDFTKEEIELAQPAYEKFLSFWGQHESEVVATEKSLVSRRYKYGGTLDLVALHEGRMTLFDYKTSKRVYDSHLFQAAGYVYLWNENYIHDQIDDLIIVRIGREKRGDFQLVPITKSQIKMYWRCFKARLGVLKADARTK